MHTAVGSSLVYAMPDVELNEGVPLTLASPALDVSDIEAVPPLVQPGEVAR